MPGNVFRSILTSNCRKADRFQAKQERGAKRRLHRFKISGRLRLSDQQSSRLCRTPGPPSTAGFVFLDGLFLRGRRVPANLPVGRDLTIRRKIENGRYYCAFGRSKAHNSRRAPCRWHGGSHHGGRALRRRCAIRPASVSPPSAIWASTMTCRVAAGGSGSPDGAKTGGDPGRRRGKARVPFRARGAGAPRQPRPAGRLQRKCTGWKAVGRNRRGFGLR
jgi:hypothetical protein